MKKQLKKDGITLISLVITVIVLLILAGVAITMAVDADGLFPRAEYAKDQWNNRVEEEGTSINNALLILNKIDPQGGTGTDGEGDEDGDEPTLPEGWNKETIASVVEEDDRKAPIPSGYVASQITGEDKISDGLVIYEEDAPVTGDKYGEEHKAAMTTRNQYVWIPVDDINSMVMCQNHPNDNLDTETALCTTCKEGTPLVGKLYINLSSGLTKPQLAFDANSGYREPAVVTGNNTGNGNEYDGAIDESFELGTADVFLAHLKEEFSNMAKSVAKYKGFYISRYEIQANAASKQEASVLASDTANMWYGLYNTIKNSNKPNYSTVAQMIWGCQYDQVMLFVDGNPDETGATFDVKTKNDDTRKRTSPEASGSCFADLVCNIYDLENNYREWTVEANEINNRVIRGGSSYDSYSASDRISNVPTVPYSDYSSRATLYVKL